MTALASLTRNWPSRAFIIIALTSVIGLAYTPLQSTSYAEGIRQDVLIEEDVSTDLAPPGRALTVVASLVKLVMMMLVPALLVIVVPRALRALLRL